MNLKNWLNFKDNKFNKWNNRQKKFWKSFILNKAVSLNFK